MKEVKIVIDNKEIITTEDKTILQAALENGIYIPHLCHHENLHPSGGCRMCVVGQEGVEGVITSCVTKVKEGMVINTKAEAAEKVRKLSVDLMFKAHPEECTGCPKFGKCQFQSISQYVGDTGRNFRHYALKAPSNKSNPLILHEMYRCILCGRCVRVCEEVRGVGVLKFKKIDGRLQVVIDGDSLKDADCRFCGACIEVCPTGSIRDQEGVIKQGVSREKALVPCTEGCPAGINIPKYIRFIREGNYPAAAAVVREKAPFPNSLGHICTHNCEMFCRRKSVNETMSIRNLKRFAASHDDGSFRQYSYKKPQSGKKVGIIGAGPAGLTAAYYLAKSGHKVTVFEKLPYAGGMMRVGIPEYRLPREVIEKEVDEIRNIGVEIIFNTKIESCEQLKNQGFDAVFAAVGTHKGVRLPLEGNDLEGVLVNTEFLRGVSLKEINTIGEKVVVLGGGNVAIDCAGVAKRLGAKEVHMACLESAEAMTADPEEIAWAKEEGILIHNSRTFERIIGENGKVTGIQISKVKSFCFDEQGRAVIEKEENSQEIILADNIIFAVGQVPDIDVTFGLELGRGNRIIADEKTMATAKEGIYAAGDAVTGTKSVIQAIANARIAASNIDIYLGGNGDIEEKLSPDQNSSAWLGKEKGFAYKKRVHTKVVDPEIRCSSFCEMDLGFDEESAKREADRCLQCDLRLKIAPQKFWSDYVQVPKGGEDK
ncbi:FAD-dependent oxidoreductase [Clostridium sp. SYSU_GA19001]|uniref:FAD-dependent oxidoreductase n=1 Tax=Clostridium caldaquaticum TaxID=2940653 RepID=UPI002076FD45|nr:FAD-dependent oxidoreductase [Clostridium caldaquaticum]MCM8709933.1 FAD-dependent oxidoreductase [Clostridium caldaquaticum]